MTVTISIDVIDQTQAVDMIASFIDWERELRAANGPDGHIPVTIRTQLADQIRNVRRTLQIEAGLVKGN